MHPQPYATYFHSTNGVDTGEVVFNYACGTYSYGVKSPDPIGAVLDYISGLFDAFLTLWRFPSLGLMVVCGFCVGRRRWGRTVACQLSFNGSDDMSVLVTLSTSLLLDLVKRPFRRGDRYRRVPAISVRSLVSRVFMVGP